MGQGLNEIIQGNCPPILLYIHSRADGGKKMGVVRGNDLLSGQTEGADKGIAQFWKEMERPAKEGHVSADGLSAGQAADGLVHHCLENGGGQIFSGGALVNQGLDIGLGKYAAAGGDGVDGLVIGRVFIEAGGVGL